MDNKLAFYQCGPRLGNPFLEDEALQRFIKVTLKDCPDNLLSDIFADLEQFGDKCAGPYLAMAADAERFKPTLEQFDQWGRRVDRVHVSTGWRFFKTESAIEGLVATAYEGREAAPGSPLATQHRSPHARVHQALKLLLFSPSSGMFSCPLAMTD